MKRLLILAAALLLLALAACSAAEPAQTPEGTDTGSPEPVSWNGKGACYTAERVIYDVDAWAGCSLSYNGEEYSLLSAEDGRLMVMRGETELFSPEGSAGISMAADESGLWLASVCAEGTYLRLRHAGRGAGGDGAASRAEGYAAFRRQGLAGLW